MTPWPRRHRTARAILAVAALTLAGGAEAAGRRDAPDGVTVGPFIFSPGLRASMSYDTNVFRNDLEEDPADTDVRGGAGLRLALPFGYGSSVELWGESDDVSYVESTFATTSATRVGVDLQLEFRSSDRLRIRDRFRRDFVQVRGFDIGEGVPDGTLESAFFGEPFHENTWSIQLDRSERGRQGYLLELERNDFVYRGDETVGFFNSRGFRTAAEYRQPIGPFRSLLLRHESDRFNHYDPNVPESQCLGVPFRRELQDRVEVGIDGLASRGTPYLLRVGWGRLRYLNKNEDCLSDQLGGELGGGNDFQGVTGYARLAHRLGEFADLLLALGRRPLPSNYDTYYVDTTLRSSLQARIAEDLRVGFLVGLGEIRYGDVITTSTVADPLLCGGERRQDFSWEAGMDATWKPLDILTIGMRFLHDQKQSNCEVVPYESNSIQLSVNFGWY